MPSANVGYVGMNRAHSPLGNLLVRQAIAHAVNRAQIVANDYPTETEPDSTQLLRSALGGSAVWGRDSRRTDPALPTS